MDNATPLIPIIEELYTYENDSSMDMKKPQGNGHYQYTTDLLKLEECVRSSPRQIPPQACVVTTPLSYAQWQEALALHPDRLFVQYLLTGISQGFRIGYDRSSSLRQSQGNMQSAIRHSEPVVEYLETEIRAGRVVGPLDDMPFVKTSRFEVIPKRSQQGKWRLILDLSSPHNNSVNDGISKELCSVKYATVDQAVANILRLGRHTQLAKMDIEHAYRNVPINPDDRDLLGMNWGGKLYIDTVLPFGLRSAPKIFAALADALEWVLEQNGVSVVIHYLDDFLVMGPCGSDQCKRSLEIMIRVCKLLGLPLKWQKMEGPTSILVFLGILLDTNRLEMRLPEDKLQELRKLIAAWSRRRAGKKRDILSLIGKLAHAAKIILPGRTFVRRMIDTAMKAKKLDHWIHLTAEFRSDLAWWHCFLESWNGLGMMQSVATEWTPQFTFVSDASGRWGCGAFWSERWIQCAWNGRWSKVSIAVKELLPILLAVAVWGSFWWGCQVRVLCDNMAVVNIITARTSKDGPIMHLLRGLHFVCAYYNINLRAAHIAGVDNSIADAISRNSMQAFFALAPSARRQPTPIPQALWRIFVESQPDWLSDVWRRSLTDSLRTASQQAQEELTLQRKQGT